MDLASAFVAQLKVLRKELKNIRQEMYKLKAIHEKEVSLLKSYINSDGISSSSLKFPQNQDCPRIHDPVITQCETSSEDMFHMKPIGYIKSCFKTKNGTPRQASLCPDTKASLRIDKRFFFNPEHSLEGLENFSHIWIMFIFHQNGPVKSVKAKVHPPRLNGSSVGVFASRSPHRPNPIGLSLIKLVKVEGCTLHLSGIDLINGTPVLDVKPYIPSYDSPSPTIENLNISVSADELNEFSCDNYQTIERIYSENITSKKCEPVDCDICKTESCELQESYDMKDSGQKFDQDVHVTNESVHNSETSVFGLIDDKKLDEIENGTLEVRTPSWLQTPPVTPLEVSFTLRAEKDLQQFHSRNEHENQCIFCLDFLEGKCQAKSSIIKLLQTDPRSVYRRNKCFDRLYYCPIDSMHITCWFDESCHLVEVLRIQPLKKMKIVNNVK